MPRKQKDYIVTISNYPKSEEDKKSFAKNLQDFNQLRTKYTVEKLNLSKNDMLLVAREVAKLHNEHCKTINV